jgi:putative ABC transport system permease protein
MWQGVAAAAAHRLRSSLGALAIAAAVATIVIVVAALDGVAAYARTTTARAFGSETFLIAQVASPGRVSRRELQEQLQRNPAIRRIELTAMERLAGGLVEYAPNAQTTAEVVAGGRTLTRTAPSPAPGRRWPICAIWRSCAAGSSGPMKTAPARRSPSSAPTSPRRCIPQTPSAIHPPGGRRFEIIGLQDRLGNSGGASLDRYVWIPLSAYERAFGSPRSLQIFAKTTAGRPSVDGEDRARISLRASRRLEPGVADTFDLLTPDAARGFVLNLSQRIGAAAGPISAMALLAAIVVVTNTVLVSVTTRTREIGVRRALGASRARRSCRRLPRRRWWLRSAGWGGGGGRARATAGPASRADRREPTTLTVAISAAGLRASSPAGIRRGGPRGSTSSPR